MAQPPITRKESPEKDARHTSRQAEHGTLPDFESGEPRPGQLRSDHIFPSTMTSPEPQVYDDKTGLPVLRLSPDPGTTLKFTITDVITYHQAEDAGQAPPKRLEKLPEDAVKKAKLTGIIKVSDDEREELQKEADEDAKQRSLAQGRYPPPARVSAASPVNAPVHAAPLHGDPSAHTAPAPLGAGKTPAESSTQAKYDNRGGGEEKK
jgi:hypothetical protein